MPKFSSECPPAPRVARPEDIQVHDVSPEQANNHPGKIIGIAWEEGSHIGLNNVTEPAGCVIVGAGREAQGVSVSPNTSAVYAYDLTVTNVAASSHPISCESQPEAVYYSDPMPDRGAAPGFSYFEDCLFGGKRVINYHTSYISGVPGLYLDDAGGGRVATKWWAQPKAPRKWGFEGCTFWASQEHALYLHWAHSARIENCTFYADGGTAIQAVWRYGRPETDRYHGNPSMSPPEHGDFIVKNCTFNDEEIWAREASALTIVGWPQGNVWLEDLTFHGSGGAIALWTDSYKGQYSSKPNGDRFAHILGVDEFGDENIQVYPGGAVVVTPEDADLKGYPFNTVYARRINVKHSPNHDREQIMLTGARRYEIADISVDSGKPQLVIGAEGGGSWKFHPSRVRLNGDYPYPKYWDGDRYQTATPETHPNWFSSPRR